MKICVFGATGKTGRLVVEQALAAGHEVTASARNPADVTARHAALRVVQGNTDDLASIRPAIDGQDAVIYAAGSRTLRANTVRSVGAAHVTTAMRDTGVRRLVWLSAAGVADSIDQMRRTSFFAGRIFMPLVLGRVYADAAIAERTVRDSGLDWIIVRPVELTRGPARGAVRVTPLADKVPKLTISRADVAAFLLDQTGPSAALGQALTISD